MKDLWDDVPDVHLDGRTILAYPDPHPEFTAKVWDRWRADLAKRHALRDATPDEDAGADVYKNHEPPVITLAAEEFDEPCSPLAAYVKLALQSGWDLVELAHSKCTARGKVIQSGQRAGSRHPDRDIETQWCKLAKPGVGRAIVSYVIINGKTESTSTYRSFNGLAGRADAEMKGLIKNG